MAAAVLSTIEQLGGEHPPSSGCGRRGRERERSVQDLRGWRRAASADSEVARAAGLTVGDVV